MLDTEANAIVCSRSEDEFHSSDEYQTDKPDVGIKGGHSDCPSESGGHDIATTVSLQNNTTKAEYSSEDHSSSGSTRGACMPENDPSGKGDQPSDQRAVPIATLHTSFEPNSSRSAGHGISSWMQSLLAISAWLYQPRQTANPDILPEDIITGTEEHTQGPPTITERSEQAYIASCTTSKYVRELGPYGQHVQQMATETEKLLRELREQRDTEPVGESDSSTAATASHGNIIAIKQFATGIETLEVESPALAEQWRRYYYFSNDWSINRPKIIPKTGKVRFVSEPERVEYVDGVSCQPKGDSRKDSATNEEVQDDSKVDKEAPFEDGEGSTPRYDGSDQEGDSSSGDDSPPPPPTSTSKHLSSPHSLKTIQESPQESSEDRDAHSAHDANNENNDQQISPLRTASLGAASISTTTSERVRRSPLNFSPANGQTGATG